MRVFAGSVATVEDRSGRRGPQSRHRPRPALGDVSGPYRCSVERSRGDHRGELFRAVSRNGKVQGRGLHPNAIGEIVKRAVVRAGYPPETYAGHSLRVGFATQAARNGASAFEIMRQTGHRSVEIVSRYVREAELFQDAAAGKLGL